MTVLDSCGSMQNQGAKTTANNTAPDPIQISSSNFQGQHFISFDINSYQKLVNIPRPSNSYLNVQPGLQQLLPVQQNTSNVNQQYVHVQLPNMQEGGNFIQLPAGQGSIPVNSNGLDCLQEGEKKVADAHNAIQLLQASKQKTCNSNVQIARAPSAQPLRTSLSSHATPLHKSSSLNITPIIISGAKQPLVNTDTVTSLTTGPLVQPAPILQINNTSKGSMGQLAHFPSQLASKITTSTASTKPIKILPSAVSTASTSLFKALQEVGSIMMVKQGQSLTGMVNSAGKQQLIIPKSTSPALQMFVPITMANNVSVLTNQGGTLSNDRLGQFGSGTTLRIQTQIAPCTAASSSNASSSVTIHPQPQKFLIPLQPSSVQQQYVLQTLPQCLTATSTKVSQHSQKAPPQTPIQHQLQLPAQLPQEQERGEYQQQDHYQDEDDEKDEDDDEEEEEEEEEDDNDHDRNVDEDEDQQQSEEQQQQQQQLLHRSQETQNEQLNCQMRDSSSAPLLNKSSTKCQSVVTTPSITNSKPLKKPCNCTKSQCLKLYCECFANGEFCSSCNCRQCLNNISHELQRSKAIKSCLERNPYAFHPKIGKGKVKGDNERRHTKGCNCKRSGCLKNYCECYEAKILCSGLCKCSACKNFEESADRKTLMHLADAAEVRVLQQNAAKTKLASQINIVQKKPMLPGKEKLPFTFMTADVSKATCGILMTRVQEDEVAGLSEVETEQSIIEEFSRCLNQIIEKSVNFKKGRKR